MRGSRRTRWSALAGVLLSTLLTAGSAGADDDVVAGLLHPLQAHRRASEQALAEREDAEALLRELVKAPDPRLRAAGWRVLTQLPRAAFATAAVASMSDTAPAVGLEAARALLAIATVEPGHAEPRVPHGSLDAAQRTALAHALAASIEAAPATELPAIAFKLGEGAVPCLREIAASAHFRFGARRLATRLLARIGGDEAQAVLVDLIKTEWDDLTTDVLYALAEVGMGAHADRVYWTLRGGSDMELPTSWRDFLRTRFRERGAVFRCIARSPPTADANGLRDQIRFLIERRRFNPSRLVEMVRALLALGTPTDADLVMIVEAAGAQRNRKNPRAAEMGYALASLTKFKDREAVRDEARRLLEDRDRLDASRFWKTSLPESVEAWLLYFVHAGDGGGVKADAICEMATRLILGDGETTTYASRRLGALLWNEMRSHALPPRGLVVAMLGDDDAWVQRYALRWLDCVEAAEAKAAVVRGLTATDVNTVLAAAETGRVAPSEAALVRLLTLSVEGSRSQRTRAWRFLNSRVAKSVGDELTEPDGLDERLRSAAHLESVLGLAKNAEASGTGLRKPAGR